MNRVEEIEEILDRLTDDFNRLMTITELEGMDKNIQMDLRDNYYDTFGTVKSIEKRCHG